MRTWIQASSTGWATPARLVFAFVAVLAVVWVFELQYAIRHVYLVPVWELALFDEMLLNAVHAPVPKSLLSLAWHYTINGHWLFVPFWLFHADFSWDEATGRIPILVSWLSLLVLAAGIGARAASQRSAQLIVALLVAIAAFWPAAMESMISPLQVVTSLSLLFGMWALQQVEKPAGGWAVVAGVVFAFASMASFAYGVALWPWLVLALVLDRRWTAAVLTLAAGACLLVVYFKLIGAGHASGAAGALDSPAAVLGYLLAQAGVALAYVIHSVKPLPAQLAGVVLLAAHAALSWQMIKPANWANPRLRGLWLIAGWLLSSMLLTAIGRHSLGPAQGMASRYLVPSVLYPACVIAMVWSLAASRPRCRQAISAMTIGIVIAIATSIPSYAERFAAIRANQRAAILAEAIGVTEMHDGVPNTQLNLWPLPKVFAHLREQRMGVYGEAWVDWLGSEFSRFDAAIPRRCEAGNDHRTPYRGGERLLGWIYSPDTREAPDHALFVHEGRIVGVAFMLQKRPDLAAHFAGPAPYAGYYGYVPNLTGEPIRIYGYFADGSICPAGSVPAVEAMAQP